MTSRLERQLADSKREAWVQDTAVARRQSRSTMPRLIVLMLLAVTMLVLFQFTSIGELLKSIDRLRAYLDGFGPRAEVTFALLTAALIAIGTPRLLFYGAGGLLFGFWQGLAAALVGSLLGSIVMFRIARWGGRRWVRRRFGEHRLFGRLASIRPTVLAVIMVRQLPLSNVLINVGLALSRVRSQTFMLGTLIGFLPQGVIACLIGSGLADGDELEGIAQVAVACVLAATIGIWAYHRQAKRLGGPDA